MDTPSSRLVAAAQAPIEVVDAQGRRLSLRRMTALDKLRLFKAAGPTLSQNRAWLGMAVLACAVTAIDDVPVPPLVSEGQIEAMVQRLGDNGVAAIGNALERDRADIDKDIIKN
jgi:hypothetical protein